ncbi:MAG TPA: site-2 protease family protein [Candidatus Tectomicrobia bacterium]
MQAQIRLGRIFGVDIGLHYSWFIIALLIMFSLGGHFYVTNPQWGSGVIWLLAIITGLLFFAALTAHELSHALVAKARGIPVRSITLFALGGVARIEKEAVDPKTELLMDIIGPVTSVVIGMICLGLAWASGWTPMATPAHPLAAMLVWLGYINIALAVFNMIPGFPLDGGRVLRALIWWVTGNANRSTRIAAGVGQIVALLFITVGILRFFAGAGFGGLWLAFIGWFLLDAARASATQVELVEGLRGVRVRDVMSRDCPTIPGQMSLQRFAEEHLLRTAHRCFVVVDDSRIAGLITPHEVKEVPRERWSKATVAEVMRPLAQLRTIRADALAAEALEMMGREDVNQLPVTANAHLEGIISRGHIVSFLRTRAELDM